MKGRLVISLAAILLVGSIVLAACASATQPAASSKPAAEPAKPAAEPAKPAAEPAKAVEPAKPAPAAAPAPAQKAEAPAAKPAAAEKSDADVVKIGPVKVSLHTDVFAADKLGYFKDEGLNVELKVGGAGTTMAQALESGALNLTGLNVMTLILGLSQGYPFAVAADNTRAPAKSPSNVAILVRTDGSVEKPKDLEGKTVGIIARKSLHELYLTVWAKKNQVDASKIKFIEVPYANMVDAVTSKQLDAAMPFEPFLSKGLDAGKVKVLAYFDTDVDPGHANSVWAGYAPWMKAHPIAMKKFAKAIYRAHDYVSKNQAERIKLVAEWTGADAADVAKWAPDGFAMNVDVALLQKVADQLLEAGFLDKPYDAKSMVVMQ